MKSKFNSLGLLAFIKRLHNFYRIDQREVFQEDHLAVYNLNLVSAGVDGSSTFDSHPLPHFLHQALEEVDVNVELILSILLLLLLRSSHDNELNLVEDLNSLQRCLHS
jgi:hypothetical protein